MVDKSIIEGEIHGDEQNTESDFQPERDKHIIQKIYDIAKVEEDGELQNGE